MRRRLRNIFTRSIPSVFRRRNNSANADDVPPAAPAAVPVATPPAAVPVARPIRPDAIVIRDTNHFKEKVFIVFQQVERCGNDNSALRAVFDDPENRLTNWDVRNVTNLSYTFFERDALFAHEAIAEFVQVSEWDVSNVTEMKGTFNTCPSFNQPLNRWDVSNVTDAFRMMAGCSSFNQPLNNWNVSNMSEMRGMFSHCASFNQPLNRWDVSNATDMSYMFSHCTHLQQDFSRWYNISAAYRAEIHLVFNSCPLMTDELTGHTPRPRPAPVAAAPPTAPLNPRGVAFEVHNYMDSILPELIPKLQRIHIIGEAMEDETLDMDTCATVIREALDAFLQEHQSEYDDNVRRIIVNLFSPNRIDLFNIPFFGEHHRMLKGIIDFVNTLPPEWKSLYFSDYVEQTAFAYRNGTATCDMRSRSCPKGAYERIITSISLPIRLQIEAVEEELEGFTDIRDLLARPTIGVNNTTLTAYTQRCAHEEYAARGLTYDAPYGTPEAERNEEYLRTWTLPQRTNAIKRCVKQRYVTEGVLNSVDTPNDAVENFFADVNEVNAYYGGKHNTRRGRPRARATFLRRKHASKYVQSRRPRTKKRRNTVRRRRHR